ncbi:MarR family transcriptional regulator [Methylopila jiangsuensis]|uniref:MarR family transcriptional regulator n=1 Tax=Methylopila jiangsuensis TaxID=586230 RepID=A0A9W6JG18_9HYPH|nr:MarR family winged helix-turn-helix transcriptional regulator [Methylopila jiangsuensis]MDR6285984.1 DNA-binding MarR family transcriptional regulator [Methylopila jiangsuensis]GLK75741.1 MarR family transcriptional regulator [Methylopila jiangsuensis]
MSKADAVPFETTLFVKDHCLCLATQRAARALARRFDEALKPAGLTSGQFSLLHALNREAPPSIGAVASLLAMDRTTLTANLKPLERRGLLTTAVDPADRRGRRLSLTDAGRAALAAAMPIWRATHAEIDARLQAFDGEAMRSALGALA